MQSSNMVGVKPLQTLLDDGNNLVKANFVFCKQKRCGFISSVYDDWLSFVLAC